MDKYRFRITLEEAVEISKKRKEFGSTALLDGEYITFFYNIVSKNTFSHPKSVDLRGITFSRKTGEPVSRPWPKFFNAEEKPDEWRKAEILTVTEKIDGTMVHPFIHDGKVYYKTKKGLTNEAKLFYDTSRDAFEYNGRNLLDEFVYSLLDNGFTPIFEFYHPSRRIVIDYGDRPRFWLAGARVNENGKILLPWEWPALFINPIADFDWTTKEIEAFKDRLSFVKTLSQDEIQKIKEEDDREGVVVYTTEGLFKVKTSWYLSLHKVMDSNERHMFYTILNGADDDLVAKYREIGEFQKAEQLIEMKERFLSIVEKVVSVARELRSLNIEKREKYERASRIAQENKWPKMLLGITMSLVNGEEEPSVERVIKYMANTRKKAWESLKRFLMKQEKDSAK